jgi:hypothetical protein
MSMFVAALLAPRGDRVSGARMTVIFFVSMILVISFVLLRYGNEKGKLLPKAEIMAINHLYDPAGPHSSLLAASPSVPWKFEHYEYTHDVMSEWENWRELTRRSPRANSPRWRGSTIVVRVPACPHGHKYRLEG